MLDTNGVQGSGFGVQGGETPKSGASTARAEARWRVVSGISLAAERGMSLEARRAGLRLLYKEVERLIRVELKAAAEETEFKEERTFLWEPVGAVCFQLEIGPTVLSRLIKELRGMSTSQLVDKIRAEDVKEKMRAALKELVRKRWYTPGSDYSSIKVSERLRDFWNWLKAVRRSTSFSYATWAIEFGFANYTRFYRACLLCYKKTPTQIEDEVLREYAEYFELTSDLGKRKQAEKFPNDAKYAAHRAPYQDRWAVALKERPEFILRMREELGLAEEVLEIAGD